MHMREKGEQKKVQGGKTQERKQNEKESKFKLFEREHIQLKFTVGLLSMNSKHLRFQNTKFLHVLQKQNLCQWKFTSNWINRKGINLVLKFDLCFEGLTAHLSCKDFTLSLFKALILNMSFLMARWVNSKLILNWWKLGRNSEESLCCQEFFILSIIPRLIILFQDPSNCLSPFTVTFLPWIPQSCFWKINRSLESTLHSDVVDVRKVPTKLREF